MSGLSKRRGVSLILRTKTHLVDTLPRWSFWHLTASHWCLGVFAEGDWWLWAYGFSPSSLSAPNGCRTWTSKTVYTCADGNNHGRVHEHPMQCHVSLGPVICCIRVKTTTFQPWFDRYRTYSSSSYSLRPSLLTHGRTLSELLFAVPSMMAVVLVSSIKKFRDPDQADRVIVFDSDHARACRCHF